MTRLTGLYVPGDRPDRFEKAASSGADLVVFDLEDAVAPAAKAEARSQVVTWLRDHAETLDVGIEVRVNAGDLDDLRAVAELAPTVGVRLPKTEELALLDDVAAHIGRRPLTALLESARAVLDARAIGEHPAVTAIALGESDLRSQLGGADQVLDHARLTAVFAAHAAGLDAPMISVFPRIADEAGLIADTRRGADLGLVGRMAVHPRQLAPIRAVFAPTPEQVAWAREVQAALGEGGVATLRSGEMVDRAMRGRADAILRAVEQHG
ncbi:HpcH/HpaI aldolase/citrate lyase family protein [Microbacterium sp. ZW T5_56]|uniref:HpcH/HpaI aldolase/citrate lyase family protein n=1 Tax=Microbacterium sp. ZW T5_56 TaxID=3378081 RepID=UPI00385186E3